MNDLTPRYEDPDNTLLFKIAALLERPVVTSFDGRTGAVTLNSADVAAALGFTPGNPALYVLKAGDTMSGTLNIAAAGAALTTENYIETGFQFAHLKDAIVNAAPVAAEFYHDSTAGTPAVGNGVSVDFSMDSATVNRQVGARMITSWTVATDATRTSQIRFFVENSGSLVQALQFSATTLGFYGVAAVARPLVPTGSSTDTVISALQSLGLFQQS